MMNRRNFVGTTAALASGMLLGTTPDGTRSHPRQVLCFP